MNVGSDELVPLLATRPAEAEVDQLLARAEALGLSDDDVATATVLEEPLVEFVSGLEEPVAEESWEEQVGAEAWTRGLESTVAPVVDDELGAPAEPRASSARPASWREVRDLGVERFEEPVTPRRSRTSREQSSPRRWPRVAAVGLLVVVLGAGLVAAGVGAWRPAAPTGPAAQMAPASEQSVRPASQERTAVAAAGSERRPRQETRERVAARERARAQRAEREVVRARAASRRHAAEARRLRLQMRRVSVAARPRPAHRATAVPSVARVVRPSRVPAPVPVVRRASPAPDAAVQAQRALSPDFSK